jgi:hypothetical protein
MYSLYFAHDSWIDRNEPRKLNFLLDTAVRFGCEFRYLDDDPYHMESKEGYLLQRYVVAAPTFDQWEQFRAEVAKTLKLRWFPISEAHYWRLSHADDGTYIPDAQEYNESAGLMQNNEMDAFPQIAHFNEVLKEMLAKQSPFYFAYDWLLPVADEDRRAWLDAILRGVLKLGWGRSLRLSGSAQPHLETYMQTFVLRVFSPEELPTLTADPRFMMSITAWRAVPAEDFLHGTPLDIPTINVLLKKLGQA